MRRTWHRLLISATLIAGSVACARCAGSTDAGHASAAQPAARSSETADRTGAGRPSTTAATDVCGLLPAAEVTEVTGLPIERVQKKPDGCEWYATATAQQQKGVDTARDTFKKLSAQEPKTADEGVKSVQDIFNGLRGAAGPNQPVFAVTVQHNDVDQAEALLRGTVAMNGGHVDAIDGLGDRAFAGPMGAFFYVRKGAALITFGGVGSRDQTIALARRIVPRIQ
jgi:hypothetical protein